MSIEIRPVQPDEFELFVETMSTGFLDRPDVARIAAFVKDLWEPPRTLAAWDGGRMCGTFRSWATEMTVTGGARLPASAVTAVTVLPSHRRRGILRLMAAAEHAAIRERGEVFGLLNAAEYPIYGRFGYGPATRTATWTLSTQATSFLGAAVSGVEVVKAGPECRDAMRAVYDAWRVVQPGELWRRPFRWDDELGLMESAWGERWKGFVALHRDASGTVDGYARYRGTEKWEQRQPRAEIRVNELHALNPVASHALWRFIGEVDLVATVIAEGRTVSDPLPWMLTNHRAAVLSEIGDGLWVRIFDVVRALESRTYERTGSVALEVVDPEIATPIRVLLDVTPDGARCTPTRRTPDLTLPIAALGAIYLGGTRLRDIAVGTGADEHRAGSLARTEALFRTTDEPWCSTFF